MWFLLMLCIQSVVYMFIQEEYHMKQVEDFLSLHSEEYRSVKRIDPGDGLTEPEARNLAV